MSRPQAPPVHYDPQEARVLGLALRVGWDNPPPRRRQSPAVWWRVLRLALAAGAVVGLLWGLHWAGLPCP